MKKLLPVIFILSLSTIAVSQNTIPNGDMESWNTAIAQNPQFYSSTNWDNFFRYTAIYPPNITRVTDAYHGSYAIRLYTDTMPGDYLFAHCENGSLDGSPPFHGGTPYNQTPTGIRGYYKSDIQPGDSAEIIVNFSAGGVGLNFYMFKLYGTHSTYTPFNFTFNPPVSGTPDSMMFVAVSSDAFDGNAITGSWVQLDSISLTGSVTQPANLNGDFELWTTDTMHRINDWYYQTDDQGTGLIRTTDNEAGNYAVKLVTYLGQNQQGLQMARGSQISTGWNDNGQQYGGWPFTNQDDTLAFWYKYTPSSNDSADVSVNVRSGGADAGGFVKRLGASVSYQYVTMPIHASSVPDTLIISFTSSTFEDTLVAYAGSEFIVDEVHLTSQPLPLAVTGSDATICAGQNVTLGTASISGHTYSWSPTTNLSSATISDPVATLSTPTTYTLTETVTATGMSASHSVSIAVNSLVPVGVTINPTPSGAICPGTSVTYSAAPSNGGSAPSYVWKLNGTNVGASSSYTNASLVNGDVVRCIITSNYACASPMIDSSQTTVSVSGIIVPTLSISASPSLTICAGSTLTLNTSSTGGGGSPTYLWRKNNLTVGSSTPSYSTSVLANGDVFTCKITSSLTCAIPDSANSNSLSVTVVPLVTPSVTVSILPSSTICSGSSVTFTAAPVNGGLAPTYQWMKNTTNVGSGGTTYSGSSFANNDSVACTMTSNAACPSLPTSTSAWIKLTVNPTVTASATIAASPSGTIAEGTSVTFTATPLNGGTTPSYQWRVNSTNVGTNSATYTTDTLHNNDVVKCAVTSNAACVTGSPANSNSITVTVTTGIQDLTNSLAFTVTPNPNSGHFSVMYTEKLSKGAELTLFNSIGERILSKPVTDAITEIRSDELPSGIYYLQISNGSLSGRRKIIIQK